MIRGNYDIDDEGLAWALSRCRWPEQLNALVSLAREHFGWFSKQASRGLEYPWVVDQLGRLPAKPILDIGTGISPLPIRLAELGGRVVTVDSSPIVRRLAGDSTDWNGWGFFDYACLNRNLSSRNVDVLDVEFADGTFAAAYSVSVIEHMASGARRRLWSNLRRWLQPDSPLLLTLDLVPGTDQLWNFNQGRPVETPERHGDLAVLERETSQAGFRLVSRDVLRELRDGTVDCAMLRLTACCN